MRLEEAKHNLRAYLDRLSTYKKMKEAGVTVEQEWMTKVEREIHTMIDAIERIKQGRF